MGTPQMEGVFAGPKSGNSQLEHGFLSKGTNQKCRNGTTSWQDTEKPVAGNQGEQARTSPQ